MVRVLPFFALTPVIREQLRESSRANSQTLSRRPTSRDSRSSGGRLGQCGQSQQAMRTPRHPATVVEGKDETHSEETIQKDQTACRADVGRPAAQLLPFLPTTATPPPLPSPFLKSSPRANWRA